MPDPIAPAAPAAPAAAPAAAAPAKSTAAPVKPNPVGNGQKVAPAAGGAPAPKPEGTAPPAPARLSRKVNVDGKETTLTATEDELWDAHNQRTAAGKRFEDASRIRKEAEAERLRSEALLARVRDPRQMVAAFMEANPEADPVEVLSRILQERLAEDEQNQDPNVRRARQLEKELESYKTKEQKAAEEREQQEQTEQVNAETHRIGTLFKEALSATKLPRNDITVRLMAEAEHANRKQGFSLTPQALAKATEKAVGSMVESILTNPDTTDDELLAAFPDLTKRIHKAIVGRYRAKQGAVQQPADATPRPRRPSIDNPPAGPRVVSSADEHKHYGIKGLRSI